MVEPRLLMEKRGSGEIRYAVISDHSGDLNRVLAKFGLTADRTLLVEHDRHGALATLTELLWKDMAYDIPGMSEAEAGLLAEQVIKAHERPGSQYYSNGNWAKRDGWNSMTESTFDAGVIIIGADHRHFCVWFEDED